MKLPIALTATLIPLSVAIIFLNVIICLLVALNKKLRTYTNGFIVSLSVSDLLFGAVYLPSYINNPDNEPWNGFITAIVLFTNVSNLCALTAERFLALTKPMQYRYLISKYFKYMVAGSWFTSIVISVLPFTWSSTASPDFQGIYLYTALVIFAFLPYIFIIVTYVILFRAVRQRRYDMRKLSSQDGKSKGISATEIKVAKVFFIIALLFSASWLPIVYMTTCVITKRFDLIPRELTIAHIFILSFNSLYNPILYAFLKPDFKRALKKYFKTSNNTEDGSIRVSNTYDMQKTEDSGEPTQV